MLKLLEGKLEKEKKIHLTTNHGAGAHKKSLKKY